MMHKVEVISKNLITLSIGQNLAKNTNRVRLVD